MELFKADGWNLDSSKIKLGGNSTKKSKDKKDRKNKNKEINQIQIQNQNQNQNDKKRKQEINDEDNDNNDDEIREKKKQTKKPKQQPKEKKQSESTESKPQLQLPQTKTLTPLQQKMMQKLTGSRFRWINEQLYTISSKQALDLITKQPELFDEYHDGFKSQVLSWPENPVNVFVNQVKERLKRNINAPGGLPGHKDKSVVIADMGCGEAKFALQVNEFMQKRKGKKIDLKIHSFDLKKGNERITVADIKNVPLEDNSCNVVIFCLALMGTNFLDFINEAYRILSPRGELWIAEIKSRFNEKDGTGEEFINALKLQGFFHKNTDSTNKMFTRFEFFKAPQDILDEKKAKLQRKQKFIEVENEKESLEAKRQKIPEGKWLLKPCIYKRR
ncbi:hypothetical protein WICMUC_004218 [Wickerhamomyces mucosus]|uniref:Ribosomal RNA-processing protein 8 n=1 Tax=Wickerhamomyces mucosus TaxID=1378264 RepID=A0A9P8PID9_9ASCO|nr:hypothetical protein WICMUC_004218 [Wickerhamomyces mucosus]